MSIVTPYLKRCRIWSAAFNNHADVHVFIDMSGSMEAKKGAVINVLKQAKVAFFFNEVFGNPARKGSFALFNSALLDRSSWGNRQFNKKADLMITFLRSSTAKYGGMTDVKDVYHDSRNIGGRLIIITDGFLTDKWADIPHNVEYIFV